MTVSKWASVAVQVCHGLRMHCLKLLRQLSTTTDKPHNTYVAGCAPSLRPLETMPRARGTSPACASSFAHWQYSCAWELPRSWFLSVLKVSLASSGEL